MLFASQIESGHREEPAPLLAAPPARSKRGARGAAHVDLLNLFGTTAKKDGTPPK